MLNTLIMLLYTVKHEPLIGAKCLRCLSEIMRFYADTSLDGFIPIEKELIQLKSYKQLQEIRLKTRVYFEINLGGPLSSVRILPMMLLTLAENIFKYGIFWDSTRPAQLFVEVANDELSMKAVNWIDGIKKAEYSSRKGLHSVKERLLHFYPAASSFRAERVDDCYEVEIRIKLNPSVI